MDIIDYSALQRAPLDADPFTHVIVRSFVTRNGLKTVNGDFPRIAKPGSFPLDTLEYGPGFGKLITELRGDDFRDALAEKLEIDLSDKPTMITVRGQCRERDGQIHTDSKDKVVTVLIYLREDWSSDGGRLRLLRGPEDIEDYAAEVPPVDGTMVAFVCEPDAWHGHKPYEGERRAIQLNWVSGDRYVAREQRRHMISAFFKKLFGG